MRTTQFKQVLWGVAYKTGQDPLQGDFLTNQAVPLGQSISEWVRRLWTSRDFPEWTQIKEFTPDSNHIVAYDNPVDQIDRVFTVYARNPLQTSVPVALDHELTADGIYCSIYHGTTVWIKYVPVAPAFTAELWDSSRVYGIGETVYQDVTGECYVSKSNFNQANDPAQLGVPITTETTVDFVPPSSSIPAQPGIMQSNYSQITPLKVGAQVVITVVDATGASLASETYTSSVINTDATVAFAALVTALTTDLPSFTIANDSTNRVFTMENNSSFFVTIDWRHSSTGPDTLLHVVQIQPYVAAVGGTLPVRQQTQTIFSSAVSVPYATYMIDIIDTAGIEHEVSYVSQLNDGGNQIILGLLNAISVSNDSFWNTVFSEIDTTSASMTLSFDQAVSVSVDFVSISPWWQQRLFPYSLTDSVIRGAVADLEKEWGQIQQGAYEESKVPQESDIVDSKLVNANAPLTYQQETKSRYRRGQ